MTGATRLVSRDALCVAAGEMSIDIMLKERHALFKTKIGTEVQFGKLNLIKGTVDTPQLIRDEALGMWQTCWSSSNKGQTIFTFFPNVHRRLKVR